MLNSTNLLKVKLGRTQATVREKRDQYAVKLGKKQLLETQFAEALEKEMKAQEALQLFEKVGMLLQKTSEYARLQAKNRIEDIVTSALNVVYGGGYQFSLDLVVRANRPEVDYFLESDGVRKQLKQPDYSVGGGIVDVITLALRLAIAELEGCKGSVLMDEVGRMVSADYVENVAYFLRQYSENTGRQILLITHQAKLTGASNNSIMISQINGESVVTCH